MIISGKSQNYSSQLSFKTFKELNKFNYGVPAIVALSHPCNKFPIVAASAANTAPLILLALKNYHSKDLNYFT